MKFMSLYRISFYLMLLFATLTMCLDATDSRLSMLFPTAVAVAGFAAYLTVDRHPSLGLARHTANALALLTPLLVLVEYYGGGRQLLIALPHWLVYLQLIKMFLPKRSEDDWFLYLLGLMQVMVGAFLSQSDRLGITLFTWALLALWVLGLFSLHRDSFRFGADGGRAGGAPPETEPYPGLLNLAFLLSAARVMALTLALGGAIFLLMPRAPRVQQRQGTDMIGAHMTGFDDEVELGQLGEILENDTVVMTVEAYDRENRRIRPGEEPLWRGVTLADYETGRWHRQHRHHTSFSPSPSDSARKGKIREQIRLEANDSPVLFGLRPMTDASANSRSEPELNPIDGTISRPEVRAGTFDYRVESFDDPSAPQPGEWNPGSVQLRSLLAIPEPIRARLRAIAEPVVAAIPAGDVAGRARALESFLRDSGQYGYSLKMGMVDRDLDPVLDFLINRKEGHCEYFASALTLLLRSVDIPARMVNGFKGGDWNGFAQMYSVRQKHAHSWAEAYLGVGDGGGPLWLTLDATPGTERNASVDRVGGLAGHFRQFTDLVRYLWVFYVVGFNAERQERVIYAPIRELVREATTGFRLMGEGLRAVASQVIFFRNAGALISLPGFFISFGALLILVLLYRVGVWLSWPLLRWYRGADADTASLTAGVVFYRRLAQVLAEFGLDRPPAETQAEYARRATTFLTGRGPGAEEVKDVPGLVVDAFYRVRFGHLELTPSDLTHLEHRLDALEASLRAAGQ